MLIKAILFVCAAVGALFITNKIIVKKLYLWLPSYIVGQHEKAAPDAVSKKTVHIMFMVANHYEPASDADIVKRWVQEYPVVANRHRDADGRPPRQTWFYPAERAEERIDQLELMTQLTSAGFGEIEMHLHHFNDTQEGLRRKLRAAKRLYNSVGALITVDGRTTFGFVHGNWALDNSVTINGLNCCGVNNELTVLKEEDCYADFTFPAINSSGQPRKINSIYYAKDDPLKPKSYNTGVDVTTEGPPEDTDLMLVQGPLKVYFDGWKSLLRPRLEGGGVESSRPPSRERVKQWVDANIHVKGRPEWIFIKIHTHGATPGNMNIFLGGGMDATYSLLETEYNDGERYQLHYVTAREAYNIIKAAEAGLSGNPDHYRDYLIKPYRNTLRQTKEKGPLVQRADGS